MTDLTEKTTALDEQSAVKNSVVFVIKKAASLRLSPLIYRLFTVGVA